VDERYDFWASTQGALKKLQENFQELGDWSLALAAYNAGLGRISRLVKKTGAKTFWDLRDNPEMPAETRAYVPRILAAATIGNHAVRNGLPVFWEAPIEWCKVGIPRPVSLSRLEELARVPRGVLKIGNAELRYDLTPPGKTHYIKVPRRYVDAVVVALTSENMLFDFTTHVIRKGDTLFTLCRIYQTNMSLIATYNPGLRLDQLRIGQKLIIPLVPIHVSAETANRGTDS
jgi:membrane-bound lytic murein transglycosylase D